MMHEVRTSYRLVSMGVLPVWLGILLAVGAAAAVLLLLRAELRARKRRRNPALLTAARVLLAACLGVLVLQPVLFVRREWDQPGVLARVASVMAKHQVSIASVIQNPAERAGAASLVLTTHESNERAMGATLKQLTALSSTLDTPVLLRIGDFND